MAPGYAASLSGRGPPRPAAPAPIRAGTGEPPSRPRSSSRRRRGARRLGHAPRERAHRRCSRPALRPSGRFLEEVVSVWVQVLAFRNHLARHTL